MTGQSSDAHLPRLIVDRQRTQRHRSWLITLATYPMRLVDQGAGTDANESGRDVIAHPRSREPTAKSIVDHSAHATASR